MKKIILLLSLLTSAIVARADSDKINDSVLASIKSIDTATGSKLQPQFKNGSLEASFDGKLFLTGPELYMLSKAISKVAESADGQVKPEVLRKLFQPLSAERTGLQDFADDGNSVLTTQALIIHIDKEGDHLSLQATGRQNNKPLLKINLQVQSSLKRVETIQFAERSTANGIN